MRGADEPRLWVPDQVLGAYGDQLCEDGLGEDWYGAWGVMEACTRLEVVSV